ncbi:hypothetical protein [Halonatronum saccharophilum]|uniref:hypothetical protein n=1 Tax=Halonatronum saccharophilum TaxID=150060 RepID=UPI0004814923|nr:hypothetical protein [Halonatronum saccharophilum]
MVEEIVSSSESLNDEARVMSNIVGEFRLNSKSNSTSVENNYNNQRKEERSSLDQLEEDIELSINEDDFERF